MVTKNAGGRDDDVPGAANFAAVADAPDAEDRFEGNGLRDLRRRLRPDGDGDKMGGTDSPEQAALILILAAVVAARVYARCFALLGACDARWRRRRSFSSISSEIDCAAASTASYANSSA